MHSALDSSHAKTRRDIAIQLVADHAGKAWIDAAFNALYAFAEKTGEFLTEDARTYATRIGLAVPHDNRAWGAVTVRAVKEGVIRRVGYAPSKTGHMRPMPIWKSLINKNEAAR